MELRPLLIHRYPTLGIVVTNTHMPVCYGIRVSQAYFIGMSSHLLWSEYAHNTDEESIFMPYSLAVTMM